MNERLNFRSWGEIIEAITYRSYYVLKQSFFAIKDLFITISSILTILCIALQKSKYTTSKNKLPRYWKKKTRLLLFAVCVMNFCKFYLLLNGGSFIKQLWVAVKYISRVLLIIFPDSNTGWFSQRQLLLSGRKWAVL